MSARPRVQGWSGRRLSRTGALELPPRTVRRTAEEVRASIYSLSSATPHLFGAGFDAFDARLRALLDRTAADGEFSERLHGTTVDIWRT